MAKIGLEVGLDVGGLISGAAQGARAVNELNRAMDEAMKNKDYDLYGKLGYQRDMLQANLTRFGHDTQTLESDPRIQEYNALKAQGRDVSKFTADPEFMSKIGKLNDGQEKLIAALIGVTDAIQKGDLEQIQQAVFGANRNLSDFHQSAADAADAAAPAGMKKAADEAARSISAMQIAGYVAQGIDRAVGALDKSGIISKQGAGDIAGADIDEQRRNAAMVGGTSEAIGTILGTALIPVLGPLGPALGMLAGKIPGWFMNADANIDASNEAYSQIWERQIPGAMELAALQGNPGNVRGAWAGAAGAAAEFGYSAGEGVEAAKRGAAQGLSERDAIAAAKNVFAFERGTGVDRQTALEFETRSRRFGMDNALGFAFQASNAAGMAPGQFGEFLRAMQRTFEDGISKGFVKGTQEIGANFAYLSSLTGGNELYKGEAGAQVMQNIGQGFEKAKNLGDVNDVLTFRAAQTVYDKMSDKEKNEFWGDIKTRDRVTGARILLERGFNPLVFQEMVRNMDTADLGNQRSVTMRMEKAGLSTEQSNYFYERLKNGDDAMKAYRDTLKLAPAAAPDPKSPEFDYLKITEGFKNTMATYGQQQFDTKLDGLDSKLAQILEKIKGRGNYPPDKPIEEMTAREAAAAAAAAAAARDYDRAAEAQNRAERAAAEEWGGKGNVLDPAYLTGQQNRAGWIANGFFDKSESKTQKKIQDTLFSAFESGNKDAIKQAVAVMDNFEKLRKAGLAKELDRSDAFNAMGDAQTVGELAAAMKAAVLAIDDLADKMDLDVRLEG